MKKSLVFLLTAAVMVFAYNPMVCYADNYDDVRLNVSKDVYAVGKYSNWDGVSTVSQFKNGDDYCFAFKDGSYIKVVTVHDGKLANKVIKLKAQHTIFGAVTCDESGNYYVLTGEKNTGSDKSKSTVFISKYDSSGTHIATAGDDGSSSLGYYYDSSFNTKEPFECGCDIAYSNGIVAVNYGRNMYNGHQSNSVFAVNASTMKEVRICTSYNSHSFAHRVIPFQGGFIFENEGDGYPRAFVTTFSDIKNSRYAVDETFHFWVEKGTLDKYDMYVLNNNFAHLGGVADLGNGKVILTATSAKSLSSSAEKESEQLFIQIFDPTYDLTRATGYVTSGVRSGVGGANGNQSITDYGVKFLTNFSDVTISKPQIAAGNGKAVIFYEARKSGKYYGVYYIVVSSDGSVVQKSTKFSDKATLNDCEMPVYADGKFWWTSNEYNSDEKLHIYSLELE